MVEGVLVSLTDWRRYAWDARRDMRARLFDKLPAVSVVAILHNIAT